MRRYSAILFVWLATALTGCGANVLFVSSYNQDDPSTARTYEAYESALRRSNAGRATVDFHPMDIRGVRSEQARNARANLARVKVVNSPAKVIVCQDAPAIEELAETLKGAPVTLIASGMSAHPAEYGLTRQRNCFGVWTPPDLDRAMSMVKQVAPQARRLAVLSDNSRSSLWALSELNRRTDWPLQIVSIQRVNTREEWLASVNALQRQADAILCVSFSELETSAGRLASEQEVANATARESRVPTVGLTRSAVMPNGLLLAVAPSPEAVGRATAEMTEKVLFTRPEAVYPRFRKETESVSYVNLALAERLRIELPESLVEEAAETVGVPH